MWMFIMHADDTSQKGDDGQDALDACTVRIDQGHSNAMAGEAGKLGWDLSVTGDRTCLELCFRLSVSQSPRWNRISQTGWLKWQNLFPTVQETRKSEIRVPAWSGSGEGSLPGVPKPALLYPHMAKSGKRKKKTLPSLLRKGTNPTHEDSAFMI
jgi:hypothetical protein